MTALETTLATLSEAQLAQVLQQLFSHFDDSEVPAVTPDEIDAQIRADRAYLSELTAGADSPPGSPDVRALIAGLAEAVPETQSVIEEAVARATSSKTLPIDPDTAITVLAIATSAAIIRPKFTFRRTTKKDSTDLDINLDVRGTRGLERVLSLITQFLNTRS
ncbi:hypothetical protein [Streptomyces sp. NPDC054783]